MKAYMKRAYSYYCTHSKHMDAAVSEYSRRTLEGSLRDSAVARLLVEGKLPSEPSSPISSSEDPVDLSSKGRLQAALVALPIGAIGNNVSPTSTKSALSPPPNGVKIDGHEPTVEVLQRSIRREMDKLKEAKSEVPGDWKCRYCPYTAPTSKTLYSHYQFHQQLLASQSSRAHLEWLSAYRRAKESGLDGDGDRMLSFSYPPHPNPTYGLTRPCSQSPASASGFLKAIVKAVMQGKTTGQTVSTSNIYTSLVSNNGNNEEEAPDSHPPSRNGSRKNKRKLGPHSASPCAKDAKVSNETETPSLDSSMHFQQESLLPDMSSMTSVESKQLAFMEAVSHRLHADALDSDAADAVPSLSHISHKSSYLDSLPPRKRSMEAFYERKQSEITRFPQQLNEPPETSCMQKDTSETTNRQVTHSLHNMDQNVQSVNQETIGSVHPMTFYKQDNIDAIEIKSPDSVCSEIDVGTYEYTNRTSETDRQAEETDRQGEDASSIIRSQQEMEQTSEDSGLVRSPPYRPRSTDSVSSVSSTISNASKALDEEECFVENDGNISHRGVQCEILLAASLPSDHQSFSTSSSTSTSSDSECENIEHHRRKKKKVIKCSHCGISFEDEVLHSIHMGCHSHTDPFDCNVCGKSCGNRYGFYTHIMRGHV